MSKGVLADVKIKYNEGLWKSLFSQEREQFVHQVSKTWNHGFSLSHLYAIFDDEITAKAEVCELESFLKQEFPKATLKFTISNE